MKLNPASTRYLQISMVALCLVFTGYLIYELSRDYILSGYGKGGASALETRIADQTPAMTVRPISDYAVILDRPLFSKDRKPYVPVEQSVPTHFTVKNIKDNRNNMDSYLLTAIIITDDKRIALIKSNRGKFFRLGVGEDIGGWTLSRVEPHEVSLTRGSETKTLELQVIKSPNPADNITHLARPSPARNGTRNGSVTPKPANESSVPSPTD